MDEINLGVDSALDLTLKGSAGSFKVGGDEHYKSLEVKYFLTHVSLNFGSGSDEKLLRELAPVREIFDHSQLDFDEIMQRDIDDARVSSELVPYILDGRTQDLIKFFPPIVVVALPIRDDRNKPLKYYPEVKYIDSTENKNGISNWKITRAGEVGQEVFQFEQPVVAGNIQKHDLVSFKINTSKCRLVIVDGQHRAMALLSLYRNIKDQWGDERRKPFQKYYEEWTPKYIEKFNLENINLPMIICTIPTLDGTYEGDYDLKKASRSIFLTLNKTARKVSRTRNTLLDDNDLISSFMRKTLSEIKASDARSDYALRIHNVELDQDKQKLNSPIAITGVSHLYYMIEHMLLDSGDVNGVSARSGRFASRIDFTDALDRLDGVDLLGLDVCNETRRDSFSNKTEEILSSKYQDIYGNAIFEMYKRFQPFEKHNFSVLQLRENITKQSDIDLDSMLFSGQGVVRVFEDHRSNLKNKLKDGYFDTDVPRIEAIVKELDDTESRLRLRIDEFNTIRAKEFISESGDKNKYYQDDGEINDKIRSIINDLYSNVFSTVAFQSAIVCGFFNEFERVSSEFQGETVLDIEDTFNEFIKHLNEYFFPKNFNKFKRLVSVLIGEADGDSASALSVSPSSSNSFKAVVSPGEMQPDLWTRYRYLFLEMWNPENHDLKSRVEKERASCRVQVFRSLYDRKKKYMAQELRIPEEELSKEALEKSFESAFDDMKDFLRHFERASELNKANLKVLVHKPEEYDDD